MHFWIHMNRSCLHILHCTKICLYHDTDITSSMTSVVRTKHFILFLQIPGARFCQKTWTILVIKAGLKLKLPKLIFTKMCSSIIKKEIRKIRMIFVKENSFRKSNLVAFWRSLKCFVIWLSVPHGTSNFVHPKIILHNQSHFNNYAEPMYCNMYSKLDPTMWMWTLGLPHTRPTPYW